MSNIKVTVRTGTGKSHTVEAPSGIRSQELIDELLSAFELPRTDAKGNLIAWVLVDKDLGLTMHPGKSLEENGVRNGHILYLDVRITLSPVIHIPDKESFSEAVSPQLKVMEFVQGLAQKFDLGKPNRWRVYDKDLGRFLDPDKSLAESGVLTGHHIHLEKIRDPFLVKAIVVASLSLLAILPIWLLRTRTPSISITITPNNARLSASQQQQFKASFSGNTNTGVRWSRQPDVGAISPDGVYTAPPFVASEQSVTIVATSQADQHKSVSATIKLAATPAVLLEVRPANVSLGVSEEATFTATINGDTKGAVTWSLSPSVGRILPDGRYVAPPSIGVGQIVTVTATSVADPAKSGHASVSLQPVEVVVNPGTIEIKPSEKVAFNANVAGTSRKNVQWLLSGPGQISQTGVYTAPASTGKGNITVRAMSKADPTKFGSATITVTQGSIAGNGSTVNPGSTITSNGPVSSNPANLPGNSGTPVSSNPAVNPNLPPKANTPATSGSSGSRALAAPFRLDVSTATLGPSQKQKISAFLNGVQESAIEWSLSGSGRISQDGTYLSPSTIQREETVTLRAVSKADPTKTAMATILLKPIVVALSPSNTDVQAEGKVAFQASVANTSNQDLKWSLRGPGDISKDGVYTAPSPIQREQTVQIIAASKEDSSRFATATVHLKTYSGKAVGTLIWSGRMPKNVTTTIEGRIASVGTVTGDALPGVPIKVELDNDKDFNILVKPDSSNGWRRLVIRSKKDNDSATVKITWKVR